MLRSVDGLTIGADDLDEMRDQSSVYDDLHVEARRVLDRNPEPRNLRDVTVALESMGYTARGAEALGFDSVFDLATAVYELTYLYYVPQVHEAPERIGAWRRFVDDYLAGSWYGVPWIMSVVVLFFGRVALWSSLDSTPQSEAMVSLAFFLAAVLAGGCSQMIGRKGTFYLLQKNYPLVRWTVSRFMIYSCSLAALIIALLYTFYVVPYYGLHLGELFAEFAAAIFAFLLSAAPLYMLRRFYTLALATGLALVVTLATARLFTTDSSGFRHTQLLGIAVFAGAMVVIAASYLAMRSETGPGGGDPLAVVKPPELRVVLWHTAPYAVYGMAYFVMILGTPMIVGFAYGHSLGVNQYVYPSTFEGSADLALLELVLLLGLVYASIERFGRRLRPLLESQTLNCWRQARAILRREWAVAVSVLLVASGVVAWLLPSILLDLLPSGLTASVRTPGGLSVLEVASFGFAIVPIGMLCSQYLFFLSRPRAAVAGAVAGACTGAVVTALLVQGGNLTLAAWGLPAGTSVYALITGLASFRVLSAGEESFYGSF
ncbi:MAG: hypothetical protein ABSC90_00235 [Acidimicrobiales bacterium]